MKTRVSLLGVVLGLFLFAESALAQNIIATDNASNYSQSNFTSEGNLGTGFGDWFTASSDGGRFLGTAANNGATNNSIVNTEGQSFGMWASGFSDVGRNFTPLNSGDTLSFQVSFQWDNGNKGVNLYTGGMNTDQVFNFNINSSGYSWSGGGSSSITGWDSNGDRQNGVALQFMFIQTATGLDYEIEMIAGDAGEAESNYFGTKTGSLVFSGNVNALKFYVSGAGGDGGNFYFNNLQIEGMPADDEPPGKIILNTPADNAAQVALRPTLTWGEDEEATSYTLQISTVSDFSSTVVNQTGITLTTFNVTTVLRMETAYFWRVRGVNASGNGEWSDAFSFTTTEPKLTLNGNRNTSFGGNLGLSILKLYDDGTSIYGEFERTTEVDFSSNDAFVFYLDNGSGGRSSIDAEINDQQDQLRRVISSAGIESSVINLPSGFQATHAIAIDRNFGGLWQIPSTGAVGNDELVFRTGVNSTLNSGEQAFYTFRFNKSHLDFTDAIDLKIVGVLTNRNTGRLSNESLNIGLPSSFDAGTPVFIRNYWNYPEGTVGADMILSGSEGWRFLSSPIVGATYGDLLNGLHTQGFTGAGFLQSSPAQSNVRLFDGNAYVSIANLSDQVPAGSGFAAGVYRDDIPGEEGSFPKTVSVSGEPRFSTFSATLNGEDSFTLLGNPYLFPINFNELTRSGLSSVIYVYDYVNPEAIDEPDAPNSNPSVGVFRAYNGVAGSLGSYRIAPFQGFLVHQDQATASLEFSPSAIAGSTIFRGKETNASPLTLSLELIGEGLYSSAWMHFSEEASAGLDSRDAFKLYPFSAHYALLKTFSEDGTGLDINHHPIPSVRADIPLEMSTTRGGTFTLRTAGWNLPSEWTLTLVDDYTGERYPLYEGASLRLNLDATAAGVAAKSATMGMAPEVVTLNGSTRFRLLVDPGTTTSVEHERMLPEVFELGQNFPNPFNPTTTIQFSIPSSVAGSVPVRLSVFDMLGREVAILVDEARPAGRHTVTFNASALGSGVYLYRLQSGSMTETRRMTLIK